MLYNTAGYASHVPTLIRCLRCTEGPVIEFGGGYFSSTVLHDVCAIMKRDLVTLEPNPRWRQRLKGLTAQSRHHELVAVKGWEDPLIDELVASRRWGFCLLDHVPPRARADDVRRMRSHADLLLMHSANEIPTRAVLKEFKSHRVINFIRPWPSVLLSDVLDLGTLDIFNGEVEPMDFFERIYVINMSTRPERWESFEKRVSEIDWPFSVRPERWEATNGLKTSFPPSWKVGGGAWGCLQSHCRILEKCIDEGVRSVLIFEDDAVFREDFADRARAFLSKVPDDWDHVYLGGQHLVQPIKESDGLVRCRNVNRTHAHGFKGESMVRAYKFITDIAAYAPKHHVDHRLGVLASTKDWNVYAPEEWMVGQGAGKSNVSGKELPEHWWDGPAQAPIVRGPGVAVVGCFRSGTSLVAGMLHHLGVHMGNKFQKPTPWAPTGTFEATELRRLMNDAYHDRLRMQLHEDEFNRRLQSFMQDRKREADEKGTIAGFKHPSLCLCLGRLLDLWDGDLKVIAVDRPPGEIFNSWSALHWAPAKGQQLTNIIEGHIRRREKALASLPGDRLLRLQKNEIVTQPAKVVSRIIGFLGIEPDGTQRSKAISLVQKKGG